MAVGTPILASDYNNIFNSISSVVGPSTSNADLGYGRTLTAGTVVGGSTPGVSDTVTQLQQFNLYLDLQGCYVHQNASTSNAIATGDFDVGDPIVYANITKFTNLLNSCTAFNSASTEFPTANFDEANMTTSGSVSVSSSRSSAWGTGANARIAHRVTVSLSLIHI